MRDEVDEEPPGPRIVAHERGDAGGLRVPGREQFGVRPGVPGARPPPGAAYVAWMSPSSASAAVATSPRSTSRTVRPGMAGTGLAISAGVRPASRSRTRCLVASQISPWSPPISLPIIMQLI